MRTMVRGLALTAALVIGLGTAGPAAAITNGQLDGGEHPYVGQLFLYDPGYPDPRFSDPGAWFS
ncbi:MAG: hypothetical protein JWP95_985, partial [Actinotalea sp.]|nr:hypothetical protein [Actinotalea sp.]